MRNRRKCKKNVEIWKSFAAAVPLMHSMRPEGKKSPKAGWLWEMGIQSRYLASREVSSAIVLPPGICFLPLMTVRGTRSSFRACTKWG